MLRRLLLTLLLVTLVGLIVSACFATPSQSGTGSFTPTASNATAQPTDSPASSPTLDLTSVPVQLAGTALSMSPNNFGAIACGTTVNLVFNAQISIEPGGSGQVSYTWNINNTSIPGNVTFNAGQTSQTVTYTLSNVAIQLTSTSTVSASITATSKGGAPVSANVAPTGVCRLPGPFEVVGIDMSVNPASVSGVQCGATINITYIATVIIAPDSNAGTVSLIWSTNPGHTAVSIVFAPMQTTASISITLDEISSRHTNFPRPVSISSTSPNAVNGGPVQPSGPCHG